MAEIDMTRPQPCTKFRNVSTVEWMAKLSEETNEAMQEAAKIEHIATNDRDEDAVDLAEYRLALELTDVVHVCVSWLSAMGYDEKLRDALHRHVNEKNKARGYF